MPSLFEPRTRDAILDRIARLTPDRNALWGRFTAPEMVCHVSCDLRQGLGELETAPPSVIPWPKGKGKSPPEFLATRPTTWQGDITRLRDLIRRFADRGPAAEWPPSRVFGRISGRSWGVMLHKHLDHHLRQFGV